MISVHGNYNWAITSKNVHNWQPKMPENNFNKISTLWTCQTYMENMYTVLKNLKKSHLRHIQRQLRTFLKLLANYDFFIGQFLYWPITIMGLFYKLSAVSWTIFLLIASSHWNQWKHDLTVTGCFLSNPGWPNLDSMQVAFFSAGEITQVIDSIPWVRCASGNVFTGTPPKSTNKLI